MSTMLNSDAPIIKEYKRNIIDKFTCKIIFIIFSLTPITAYFFKTASEGSYLNMQRNMHLQ